MVAPTQNYGYELDAGFPGMLADLALVKTADTLVQGEASAAVPFGAGVVQGDASSVAGTPDDAILPVDANSKVLGVVVHSHAFNRDTQLDTVGVLPENLIAVLRKGKIYVLWEGGAVTKGAPLYVRFTAAGAEQKGAFREDADTADALICRGITAAETVTADGRTFLLANVDMSVQEGVAGLT